MRLLFLNAKIKEILVFEFATSLILIIASEINAESSIDSSSTSFSDTANSSEFDLLENFAYNATEASSNSSANNSTDVYLLFNDTYDWNTTDADIPETPLDPDLQVSDADTSICNCDLVGSVCEVNCCCDEDCSEDDIKVFVQCLPQVLPYDSRYCYQENILYKNNTVYKVVKESDSLFCIVRDNIKHKLRFKDVPVYNRLEDFDKLQLKNDFEWTLSLEKESENVSDIMKAGDSLFIRTIDSERKPFHWSLPFPCFGYECNCNQPVHYMEEVTSSCIRSIKDLEMECEKNPYLSAATYSNFCFGDLLGMTSPMSTPSNMSEDTTTTIIYTSTELSDTEDLCLTNNGQPEPIFGSDSEECRHVVSSVRYDIWHDGSRGIVRPMVTFEYALLNKHAHSVNQKFAVHFHWNKTRNTNYLKRSGNPGYIFGLPLIAAIKLPNNTLRRLDKGLTILKSGPNGYCSLERVTVNFGHNLRSGCLKQKSVLSCKIMQKSIFDTLLGPLANDILVGSFGNSNISHGDNWVEVFHDIGSYKNEESPLSCNLVLHMHIHIAYAAVGPFANPQYKVVGIVYKYDSPQLIDFSTPNNSLLQDNSIHISTSVNFYDISQPAAAVFKSIPVLSAKLPHDFFYPFLLSSAHCIYISYVLTVLTLVILIF